MSDQGPATKRLAADLSPPPSVAGPITPAPPDAIIAQRQTLTGFTHPVANPYPQGTHLYAGRPLTIQSALPDDIRK